MRGTLIDITITVVREAVELSSVSRGAGCDGYRHLPMVVVMKEMMCFENTSFFLSFTTVAITT